MGLESGRDLHSRWSDGGILTFYNADGDAVFSWDGPNRKVTFPSGATLALSGTLTSAGTQTFDDITGGDTSLGITGQAAASATAAGGAIAIAGAAGGATSGAGGAITVTGGVGTAGNANGGAVSDAGGAAHGTGTGGAAVQTGGASGAGATGTGGASSVVGGASLATNGSGGAALVTGGVATGTGSGGAVTLTAGASAGAGGTGGAVNIASGAPAGGADGAVNVQTVTTGKLGFYGTTAIVKPSSVGTVTGFTAGSGTAAKDDSTFTGDTGTKAYTVGDLVKHFKLLGLLASS